MTTAIIITLCTILLVAYFFDVSAARTRIPSAVLLLFLGWGMHEMTLLFGLVVPDMSEVLPVLGTVGLILIVLEGSLELKIDPTKRAMIGKAFAGATVSAIGLALVIGYIIQYVTGASLKDSMANAIPLCIISSAIAIPTAQHLAQADREFIIYESSLSDIVGVLLFNFVVLNTVIDGGAFFRFGLQLGLMAVVSLAATLLLGFLLHRIQHHVKYVPIILLLILIYALTKLYHLPSLLFILLFGLALGNIDKLNRLPRMRKLGWGELDVQVLKLKELTGEAAFLIRALFFILFGYTLLTSEILDLNALPWSAGLVGLIFITRALQLKLSGQPLTPLLFIAPRGLITILLFLSVPTEIQIPLVSKSVLTQVILLSAGIMMLGMLTSRKDNSQSQ